MLPNYDARSIAEVSGVAFLRGLKSDSPQRNGASDSDFVLRVGNRAMLLVEAKPKGSWAPFGTSETSPDRPVGYENRLSSPSPVLIKKAVEKGLPRKALRHVAEYLAGSDATKVSTLEWGIVPKTTLERRETRLSPRESERTERIARLFVHARRALGTDAEAREFMAAPHPELDGCSPIEAAKTDLGTRRTEQILSALEYGLAL